MKKNGIIKKLSENEEKIDGLVYSWNTVFPEFNKQFDKIVKQSIHLSRLTDSYVKKMEEIEKNLIILKDEIKQLNKKINEEQEKKEADTEDRELSKDWPNYDDVMAEGLPGIEPFPKKKNKTAKQKEQVFLNGDVASSLGMSSKRLNSILLALNILEETDPPILRPKFVNSRYVVLGSRGGYKKGATGIRWTRYGKSYVCKRVKTYISQLIKNQRR